MLVRMMARVKMETRQSIVIVLAKDDSGFD